MKPSELLRGAVLEIRAHRTRSAMTTLSLSMGTAAMLYTFAATGDMARRYREAIQLAGPGRITISGKDGYVSRGLSPGLTWEDARALRAHWPEWHMVYPEGSLWGGRLRWGAFSSRNMRVLGTTEEWRRRDWVYRMRGRFLNARDVAEGARVCVLIQPGGWLRKRFWSRYIHTDAFAGLLKRHDLLGQRVLLNERIFTVVGILAEPPREKDSRWLRSGGGDGIVLVPISTLHADLVGDRGRSRRINKLEVDTGEERTVGLALRQISALLARRHLGEPDTEIKDFRQLVPGAMQQLRDATLAVLLIGVVAILAGGIGIMNVTLATVFSRVREIGIRRALGATRRDIVAQFTTEAALLGALGGLAGCALGLLAVVYLPPNEYRVVLPTLAHYAGALLLALGTAFVFSLFPAYKASGYDPVEALRYE